MEEIGIWYIASLHDPIKDPDGNPNVLDARRSDDGRWVDACWDDPSHEWHVGGAVAFSVGAS